MGSWYATCGVSRMPITEGARVKLIFIAQSPFHTDGDGGCYPTEEWEPILLPIDAEYADYGRFMPVDEESPLAKTVVEFFRKNAVPMELGENECHDIAVVPETLEWDSINEAINENRLSIRNNMASPYMQHKPALPVQFFPILEQVYAALTVPYGNQGVFDLGAVRDAGYVEAEIRALVSGEPITDIQKELYKLALDESGGDIEKAKVIYEKLSLGSSREGLRSLFGNGMGSYLCSHILWHLNAGGESSYQTAAMFHLFMQSTYLLRIKYIVPGSAGSQCESYDKFAALFTTMAEIAEKLHHRWDEEEEDA